MTDIIVYRKRPGLSGGLFQRSTGSFDPLGNYDRGLFDNLVETLNGMRKSDWPEIDLYCAPAAVAEGSHDLICVAKEYRSSVLTSIREALTEKLGFEKVQRSRNSWYRQWLTADLRRFLNAYKYQTDEAPALGLLERDRGLVLYAKT